MKTIYRKHPHDFTVPENVLLDGLDDKADNILFIHHKKGSDVFLNVEHYDRPLLTSLYHSLQTSPTVHLYATLMEKNDEGGTRIDSVIGRLDMNDFEPIFEYDGLSALDIVSHEVAVLSALLSTKRIFTIAIPSENRLHIAFSEEQVLSLVEMLHEDEIFKSEQDIQIQSYQRQPDTGILFQKNYAVTVEPTLSITGLTNG